MHNDTESLKQNLIDAGCDDEFISRFMTMDENGQTKEILGMLAVHRRQLLNQVHADERKIYCLDYLAAKLKCK